MSTNKEDKYGDDLMFESWSDINIFFPVAQQLIDPLYCMGLTPNMVTIISTVCTLGAIYWLSQGYKFMAVGSYLLGYTLDCVDGRMARKYSMGSDLGMALDCVSDNISNIVLFIYVLLNYPMTANNLIWVGLLSGLSYMLSVSYGLNEAIISQSTTGSDNFYDRRVNQLKDKGCGYEKILYELFLLINKISYASYRNLFESYDKDKIYKWLKVLKHFGPGNYCLFIGLLCMFI
jgi:hypothetical protein